MNRLRSRNRHKPSTDETRSQWRSDFQSYRQAGEQIHRQRRQQASCDKAQVPRDHRFAPITAGSSAVE
jgi:hypothetical protein